MLTLSSSGMLQISSIILYTSVSFNGNAFTVVSISIVARISTPTIDSTSIPPLRIKLSLYDDIDTLSRNLSIIKLRISVDALLLFPSEIFLTLSFNCLDELITLTPPRTSSLHLELPAYPHIPSAAIAFCPSRTYIP